jgi:RNA polymerase sigma factor (sigma-70 family)
MRESDDAELLSAYATQRSEEAFSALVQRYLGLVYSAACRQVHNPHLAQEVTQAVFIILAKKAAALRKRTVLSGWLCRTAHLVARNALKTEHRRHHRKQEAHMQSLLNQPEADTWMQLAPLLDEAVAQLNDPDRNAIVLRFYQHKPLNEVASILGVNPDAAQKRVSRAVDKLRKFFGN